VSSRHCDRRQFAALTTIRSAPMPCRPLKSAASSPTVRPCRAGIGYIPTNEVKPGAIRAPSTISPPIGFGRSSTTNGMPRFAAACIDSAIVDT
jgi:hypothetical protein